MYDWRVSASVPISVCALTATVESWGGVARFIGRVSSPSFSHICRPWLGENLAGRVPCGNQAEVLVRAFSVNEAQSAAVRAAFGPIAIDGISSPAPG